MTLLAILGLTALAAAPGPRPKPAAKAPAAITINFGAMVGDQPFTCGREYQGIGTTGATVSALDFRLYVSGVELLDASGKAVPVKLTQDGLWQRRNVALLDFENAASPCANGSEETRTVVEGTAPAGSYRGIRFTLGVPFELNHANLVEQPSPLNITSLFWVWRAGYKFLRLDVKASGPVERMFLHLGSTGCTARDTLPTSPAMSCANPNRATITFPDFDPASDVIVADVAELLGGSDLTVNQEKSAKGCMSAPDDADCAPIFDRLGLPFQGKASAGQRFFRVVKGGVARATGSP